VGFLLTALAVVIIVIFHEFGHFITAKMCGVGVRRFSIGFGPKLLSKTIGDTNYCLSAIPLGGYINMVGEEPNDKEVSEKSFRSKPAWKRLLIVAAGPVSNILLCIIVLMVSFGIYGVATPSEENVVGNIVKDYPADEAGLTRGDRILSVEQRPTESWSDIINTLQGLPLDQDIEVTIERNSQNISFSVAPVNNSGIPYIGIIPKEIVKRGILLSISESIRMPYSFAKEAFQGIYGLIFGKLEVRDSLAGPIQIVAIGNNLQQNYGLAGLLYFAAIISLNLAIFNLLPIPALDGGHIFLIAIEVIRGKPLSPKSQLRIMISGISLILLLMSYVIYNDVIKVF
jgi:regulator of sigma E protease